MSTINFFIKPPETVRAITNIEIFRYDTTESVEPPAVRTEVLEYLTQDRQETPHRYDRNALMRRYHQAGDESRHIPCAKECSRFRYRDKSETLSSVCTPPRGRPGKYRKVFRTIQNGRRRPTVRARALAVALRGSAYRRASDFSRCRRHPKRLRRISPCLRSSRLRYGRYGEAADQKAVDLPS